MNFVGAGVLDAVQLASVKASLQSALEDPQVRASVTITTQTADPVEDDATGDVTHTTVDDSVFGLLQTLTARQIRDSGGLYQAGDRILRVDADALSVVPDTASTVTEASTRYRVLEVKTDALTAHYRIFLRKHP